MKHSRNVGRMCLYCISQKTRVWDWDTEAVWSRVRAEQVMQKIPAGLIRNIERGATAKCSSLASVAIEVI